MLFSIGIFLIMVGGALYLNGEWMWFTSEKIKCRMQWLFDADPNELTEDEKKELMYYKVERFFYKASFYFFIAGILCVLPKVLNSLI